jgi:uncharacterized protein YaaN involved in tellurite resistance
MNTPESAKGLKTFSKKFLNDIYIPALKDMAEILEEAQEIDNLANNINISRARGLDEDILNQTEESLIKCQGDLTARIFSTMQGIKGHAPQVLKELRVKVIHPAAKNKQSIHGVGSKGFVEYEQEQVNNIANRLYELSKSKDVNMKGSFEYKTLCIMANALSNMGAPLPDDHKRLYFEAVSYGADLNKAFNSE